MKKFTKLMLAVAVPAAMLAGNANAVPITSWDYENQFGFASWTSTAGSNPATSLESNTNVNYVNPVFVPVVANSATLGTSLNLAWGVPQGIAQSSLVLSGNVPSVPAGASAHTSGVVNSVACSVTDCAAGSQVLDLTLTHNNFVITGSNLDTAVLRGSLLLQGKTPAGANANQAGPLTANFNILFEETTNQPGLGGCAFGTGVPPCADIFVIGGSSSPLKDVFLGNIDGYNYFLDVDITGLGGLSPQACAAAGSPSPCLGFITPENTSTSFSLFFSVRYEPEDQVPEPGTLALLGLGLAGLGFGRYRHRK